jgi:hypothetical protein
MSRDSNIVFATFSKTRSERIREWRHGLAHRFRASRKDAVGRFTQKGWIETEAEVTSCTAHERRYYVNKSAAPSLSGWAVGFAYVVNGKSYDGVLISKEEVQKRGKFMIRYNPECPAENNTLETKLDLIDGLVVGAYDTFLVLIVVCLATIGLLMKR